jgi:hypothetical protein
MTPFRQWLARRLWNVYPPIALTVQAPPGICLQALAAAAKPSQNRLHLRNLFTEGRRYYVQPVKEGFRLTSNSKVPWQYRARTTVAAVLYGQFRDNGDGATRINLHAQMRLFFLLDIFLIPLFISSIVIFAPWPKLFILLLMLALLGLSWIWHRLTATLQAAEMVYFVEKALEELTPVEVPLLAASNEDVITQDREFREQWRKFYEQHKDEGQADPK